MPVRVAGGRLVGVHFDRLIFSLLPLLGGIVNRIVDRGLEIVGFVYPGLDARMIMPKIQRRESAQEVEVLPPVIIPEIRTRSANR